MLTRPSLSRKVLLFPAGLEGHKIIAGMITRALGNMKRRARKDFAIVRGVGIKYVWHCSLEENGSENGV